MIRVLIVIAIVAMLMGCGQSLCKLMSYEDYQGGDDCSKAIRQIMSVNAGMVK